jgi:hypothetical protein
MIGIVAPKAKSATSCMSFTTQMENMKRTYMLDLGNRLHKAEIIQTGIEIQEMATDTEGVSVAERDHTMETEAERETEIEITELMGNVSEMTEIDPETVQEKETEIEEEIAETETETEGGIEAGAEKEIVTSDLMMTLQKEGLLLETGKGTAIQRTTTERILTEITDLLTKRDRETIMIITIHMQRVDMITIEKEVDTSPPLLFNPSNSLTISSDCDTLLQCGIVIV